ncbi:HNH endonuclease signature motif containing protein [Arthrobacter globiformis]|uniref:HNH endonuclease signature motif containing protein n=1 Tax=Arthrobacter globiformis TaxID=1665 RepID=UPI0027D796D1|nr:HNH endonuclease signature motif containing protein [Arthrobacter globiformis]
MDGKAAVETMEGIASSVAALAVVVCRAAGTEATSGGLAGADPLSGADSLTGSGPSSGADPLQDRADACLEALTEVAKLEARVAALQVHVAAGFADTVAAVAPPDASAREQAVTQMSLTAQVACALTVSEGSAARFLAESATLSTDLPLTLAALGSGTLSWQHARVMCDETDGLDRAAAAALEAHFLDPDAPHAARGCPAGELTPSRFRARARYWRERHHPVSIETRHRNCAKDRRLEYVPDRDGMAWLSAYLPADQAAGIWDRATAAARALQGPTESRTLTQLRVDVAAGWLLGPGQRVDGTPAGSVPTDSVQAGEVRAGYVPSPAAQVLVTVPVFSLLGLTHEPATLDGYGPIPPAMARRLVSDGAGSFLRVLTDPRDGAPLEIGRTSYRIPKPMRQWLRLRDGRCTFPGCTNHSLDNDADHLLAWADGGTTGISNLGQPCPKHHRLKHQTAWKPVGATRESPPGWISPTGRSYPAEHQDWEPPSWPRNLEPGNLELRNLEPGNLELRNLEPDSLEGLDASLPEDPDPLPMDPWPDWSTPAAA